MSTRISTLTLACCLSLAWPVAAGASTTLERIDAAYRAGDIDDEAYVLYRLYRITNKDLLPPDLVAPANEERPVRCGTPMVKDARAAVDWMSPSARLAVDLLLPRSPQQVMSYESDNFSLIVGPQFTGTEDDIDWWLDTFEHVWDVEVTGTGFDNPPCTNQYYFDVYLANTGGTTPSMSHDTWGYTDHSGDCPYVVMHPDYAFTGNPIGAAQVTAAHEFQHGIQSGYDWWEGNYWMEATATWAEDLVYDDVDDYLDYINGSEGWLAYPEYALTLEDGWHEYGNVIWVKYLAENWGGDAAVVDLWERCIDTDALGAVGDLMGIEGWTFEDGFVDFTAHLAANAFEEAALYEDVYWMGNHDTYPVSGEPDRYFPRELGSNYVLFNPAGGTQDLQVTFSGAATDDGQAVTWGAALVALTGDAFTYEALEVDADGHASGWVEDFGGAVDRVVLAISVLGGDATSTPGVTWAYEASLGEAPGDDDDDDDATPGDDDDDAGAGDDQGCGCRVGTMGGGASVLLAAVAVALLAIRRRSSGAQ